MVDVQKTEDGHYVLTVDEEVKEVINSLLWYLMMANIPSDLRGDINRLRDLLDGDDSEYEPKYVLGLETDYISIILEETE